MHHAEWEQLSAIGKIDALIAENAYFIWERRARLGVTGTSDDDKANAVMFVRREYPRLWRLAQNQRWALELVSVAAYFISQQRLAEQTAGSEDRDWALAEVQIQRSHSGVWESAGFAFTI